MLGKGSFEYFHSLPSNGDVHRAAGGGFSRRTGHRQRASCAGGGGGTFSLDRKGFFYDHSVHLLGLVNIVVMVA